MAVSEKIALRKMRAKRRSGSALIIVLWALLLLSAAVFAWAKLIHARIDEDGLANQVLQAKAMAYSGVQVAMSPQVTQFSPQLTMDLTPQNGYVVTLSREAGKLNLNYLLRGDRPARVGVLKKYLSLRGLTLEQVDQLVAAMLDWISPSNLHHLNGVAESANYHPPHRQFLSLDEVEKVMFSGPLVSLPGWKNDFTLYSSGVVDLQSASLLVLESLPGVGEPQATAFLQMRRGEDGKDNTADDVIFQNTQQAISSLGFPANTRLPPGLRQIIGLDKSTLRAVSIGHAGKVHREFDVVFRKQGRTPTILLWQEN